MVEVQIFLDVFKSIQGIWTEVHKNSEAAAAKVNRGADEEYLTKSSIL